MAYDDFCRTLYTAEQRRILVDSVLRLLSILTTACPRCYPVEPGAPPPEPFRAMSGSSPVAFTDAGGPTCYEHADTETAKPVEHWRTILLAESSLRFGGVERLSDASRRAASYAGREVCPPNPEHSHAADLGIQAYAGRYGDVERAWSYANELREHSLYAGLVVYAAASGDPTIRPPWLLRAFQRYVALRWPKVGDRCPDRCEGTMIEVSSGDEGEDPRIVCAVHHVEEQRRAALTPEERAAEDEALRDETRAKIRAHLERKKGLPVP